MTEDDRERAFGIVARQREMIGVADAGGFQLNQHFAGPGTIELHGFDGKRLASLECNSGADVHEGLLLRERGCRY